MFPSKRKHTVEDIRFSEPMEVRCACGWFERDLKSQEEVEVAWTLHRKEVGINDTTDHSRTPERED